MKRLGTGAIVLATVLVVLAYGSDRAKGQSPFSSLPQVVKAPTDNPTTADKVALGRLLFWDPILSGQKDVACATCHHPSFGYAENLDISIGVGGVGLGGDRRFAPGAAVPFVKRNSQTILNAAFNGIDESGRYDPAQAPMFWDLRMVSLENQALGPIASFEEMRGNAYPEDQAVSRVVTRLQAVPEYRRLFAGAFRDTPVVSAANLGKALAAFERSLIAVNSPFDRYMRGDETAMTSDQIRGMQTFENIGCIRCHSGPMFSDYKPHVLPVPANFKLTVADTGLNGTHAFRTASLRNVAYTAPYMHSGAFQSLDAVVRFYRGAGRGGRGGRGGNANAGFDQVDPLLRQLRGAGRDGGAIVAFLNALSDDSFDKTIPTQVPSGLHPGGDIN